MPDVRLAGAVGCGLCAAVAVFALCGAPALSPAAAWLRRRDSARPHPAWLEASKHWRPPPGTPRLLEPLRRQLERAGWRREAEAVLAATALCSGAAASLGLVLALLLGAPPPVLASLLASAPPALVLLSLRTSRRRRRRLDQAELASILELLGLELSGGGSAQAGLAAVLAQTGGPLARSLAELLAGAQLGGGLPFDVRLERLATARELPALRSLAAVLAMSRHYGSGVGDGVRALAADLRRTERRDLIARNRRAVNRVLVPAAVGVLLPFIGILLFPAVTSLLRAYS